MSDELANLEADILRCNKCGTCASVCPTYSALRRETTSARGRVSLISAYLAGEVEDNSEFEELMYYCLSCHACATTCPNEVPVDRLVLAARARMAAKNGHSLARRAIFEGLLPHPSRLDAALWPVRAYQVSGAHTLASRVGVISRLPGRLSSYGQMLPNAPLRPARASIPVISPTRGKTLGRVGYFLGCAQNLLFPDAARSTVALLNLAGFEVVTPTELVCCGMPAVAYGETSTARGLAARNVTAFSREGVEAIVTDCASCGSFLKEYGGLLADEPDVSQAAARLAGNTSDISQFLSANLPQGDRLPLQPVKVTYHDPCHLGHGQGVKKQPRDLLSAIPGVTLVEMRTPGACCGSAGSYGLTHPDVSATILDRRIGEAVETGAEVLVTGCPACQMQLEYGLRRAESRTRVRHTSEVLAEAYGVSPGKSLTKRSMSGT